MAQRKQFMTVSSMPGRVRTSEDIGSKDPTATLYDDVHPWPVHRREPVRRSGKQEGGCDATPIEARTGPVHAARKAAEGLPCQRARSRRRVRPKTVGSLWTQSA